MSERLANIVRGDDRFATTASLNVEIIADFVCPFCFVGKRRFDEALKAVQGPTDISWYPFQLNPEIPVEGLPFDEYLTSRFGSPANVEPALLHLATEGRASGIKFRFDKIQHVPNTLPIHQLMHFAETNQLNPSALAEDLLSAFFEQGRNIGDRRELIDIAGRYDISAGATKEAIESEEIRQLVLAREKQVRGSGIAGVPGFLLNRRLLVVGAQSTDTFVNAFDQAMFGEGTDALISPALH
ncbi:MAG: DsbA family oxidoreductase [Woeseiaceae bacterium]